MDAHQDELSNPFGMDEDCRNCPALCDTRERVVHGYGVVDADILFVGEAPDAGADQSGVPFAGGGANGLLGVLADLGLCEDPGDPEPAVENVFLTHLTRCRDPDRSPSDAEVGNCEAFLTAEVRMINPEILVPVGDRALRELAEEYTTSVPEDFDLPADHARSIRGRGFELFPAVPFETATPDQRDTFLENFSDLLGRDYRQTKGRRG